MEHRMNAGLGRQFEFISNSTNLCFHFIGPKVAIREHMTGSGSHRGLSIGLEFQPNLVTNLKLTFCTMLVSLVLLSLLSTQELLMKQFIDSLALKEPFIQLRHNAVLIRIDTKMPWGVTIKYLKRGMLQG